MKRIRYPVMGLLLWCSIFHFAIAQEVETENTISMTLTEDEAVSKALKLNISLLRATNTLLAKKRTSDRSINALLPSLTVSSGIMHSNEASYDATNWTRFASVKTSLNISPGVIHEIEATKLAYDVQKISYEQAKREIELSVRKYYKSLLVTQENIKLLAQNVQTAQKNYDTVVAKQLAGLASETETLSALVSLENSKSKLTTAKTNYADQLETLKQLIGINQNTTISLEGSFSSPDKDTLLNNVASFTKEAGVSLEEQRLRSQLLVAEANRKATINNSILPSFSVSWTYQPTYSSTTKDWIDQGSVSVALSWSVDSLLPFSSAGENRDSSEDTIRDLQYQLEDARNTANLNRASYIRQIEQYLMLLESYKANERLASRSVDLTQTAYTNGLADLISLQNAVDNLTEVRYSILENIYNLSVVILNLEYSLGLPFGSLGR